MGNRPSVRCRVRRGVSRVAVATVVAIALGSAHEPHAPTAVDTLWKVASQSELTTCVGGFERSLPEIDEMVRPFLRFSLGGLSLFVTHTRAQADLVDKEFRGEAALRVSAAGMGGKVSVRVRVPRHNPDARGRGGGGTVDAQLVPSQVCIHAFRERAGDVEKFFHDRGWATRRLMPGAPTQIISLE